MEKWDELKRWLINFEEAITGILDELGPASGFRDFANCQLETIREMRFRMGLLDAQEKEENKKKAG